VGLLFGLIYIALLLFFVALLIRLVYDWVQMFARDWRPRGAALVAAHVVYSVTDPPLKGLRRLIPLFGSGESRWTWASWSFSSESASPWESSDGLRSTR